MDREKQSGKNGGEHFEKPHAETDMTVSPKPQTEEFLESPNLPPEKSPLTLSDDRRVKQISSGMLVLKRFFRNKLSTAGLVILGVMFVFSFLLPLFMAYRETQVFYKESSVVKNYASAAKSTEYRYTVKEGKRFTDGGAFLAALSAGKSSFTGSGGTYYEYYEEGTEFYRIEAFDNRAARISRLGEVTAEEGFTPPEGFLAEVKRAFDAGESEFAFLQTKYVLSYSQALRSTVVLYGGDVALSSKRIYQGYDPAAKFGYEFRYVSEKAISNGEAGFTFDGRDYAVRYDEETESYDVYFEDAPYVNVSQFIVSGATADIVITANFRTEVMRQIDYMVENGLVSHTFSLAGEEAEYSIERQNENYTVKSEQSATLIDVLAKPSAAHIFGTDASGFDSFVRLMYGGRISLMVGFVVVLFEVIIGVLLGGIAGYFGKWADQLIMRVVDIFYCIPSLPLIVIFGSIMDSFGISSQLRIVYLMAILGILGWPSIARLVRGQILSLREQEFMLATEAVGLRVTRRIFKHLVPNVIPQLIVIATMNLGSTIIIESTLSFLGIGVKYPFASWGNIVNAVSDVYVMTNLPLLWIPAGVLILLTVLAFNFVGDGLRDAFDPKMKR